jgi:hypothetical protein
MLSQILPARAHEVIKFMEVFILRSQREKHDGKLIQQLAQELFVDTSTVQHMRSKALLFHDLLNRWDEFPDFMKWNNPIIESWQYLTIADHIQKKKENQR